MRLFVGLGNPGAKYAGNRHNIGFMAVDAIARRHGFAPWRRRFQGETAEGTLDRERVVLLQADDLHERVRPRGAGGRAVLQARARRHRRVSRRARTAAGKVRVKVGGGIAGHNGLRSISAHVGNDYRRVRLGIGHPGVKELVHGHVLSDFAKSERPWVEALCDAIADNAGAARDAARTRRSRTRCIWRCRPRVSATRTTTTRATADARTIEDTSWDSNAASSGCPMSASRRCSTR